MIECPECPKTFGTVRGLGVHRSRYCPGGPEADLDFLDRWVPDKPLDDCWVWMGAAKLSGWTGSMYGRLSRRGEHFAAHRWAYELLEGPIPEGYELDHLCPDTLCVRPDHLEPVTPEENDRRRLERLREAVRAANRVSEGKPVPF